MQTNAQTNTLKNQLFIVIYWQKKVGRALGSNTTLK